jgi:hypothetical protein
VGVRDIAATPGEVTTLNGRRIAGPGSPAGSGDWNGNVAAPLPKLWDTTTHEVTAAAKSGSTPTILPFTIKAPNDCLDRRHVLTVRPNGADGPHRLNLPPRGSQASTDSCDCVSVHGFLRPAGSFALEIEPCCQRIPRLISGAQSYHGANASKSRSARQTRRMMKKYRQSAEDEGRVPGEVRQHFDIAGISGRGATFTC